MIYCHHCGRKAEENFKFCKYCGKKIGGSIEEEKSAEPKNDEDYIEILEKKKSKKFIWISLFIILIISVSFFIIYKPNILGGVIGTNREKEACPYDCCPYSEYKEKQCSLDYECKNNECMAIDSDKDGLTDIEEKEIGTDVKLQDTDMDGLTDYREYKVIGTDPLNSNTDGDRYKDGDDSNPLTKDNPEINVFVSDKQWEWNYAKIILAFIGGGVVNPEMVIAESNVEATITNTGTDYSEYVNFDIVFELQNKELGRESISLGKIKVGETKTERKIKEIRAENIPEMVINLVMEQSTDWGMSIENVNYEQF